MCCGNVGYVYVGLPFKSPSRLAHHGIIHVHRCNEYGCP